MSGFILNGMITSGVSVAIVHPGYTICTHLLVQKHLKELFRTSNRPNFRVLYRGVGANLACDMTGQVTAFWSYGYFKSLSTTHQEHIGGLGAALIAAPVFNAWDRIMTRQQISGGSMIHTAKLIRKKEGLKGLFKGTSLTWTQEIFYQTAFFSIANRIAEEMTQAKKIDPIISKVVSYSASGFIIGLLTSPIQEIKILYFQQEPGSASISNIAKEVFSKQRRCQMIEFAKLRTTLITMNMLIAGIAKELIPYTFPQHFFK